MIKIYEMITKFLQFIINVLFVLQITLMILVFLTASYWFLTLIDPNLFEFARPIALAVSNFVKLFYDREVQIGGVYVDASLLLFDIIAIALVFGIAKFKYYVYEAINSVVLAINDCKVEREKEFNEALQKEVESNIKKCNNVAILVRFSAKNMFVDSCWGGDAEAGVKEKEEEAFKIFYSSIKNISGCKFAKTDDKMLVLIEDFSKVDNILYFIELSANRIRENFKRRKWALFAYIAIDVYDNKTNFKSSVYPVLEKLLTIRHKNEVVCLGNFVMRYQLGNELMYNPVLYGKYNISGEECEVWALVKKS